MTETIKQVTVLGSTGSIGVSTLDVIARHPERYRVFALTARRGVATLLEQCLQHRPRYAVMTETAAADALRRQLAERGCATEVLAGAAALAEVAQAAEVDYVMAAIVGAAGLLPTLAAVKAGKRVLLANKEALVMSGALFMEAVREHNAELLPIDSEHNAIFQCMPPGSAGRLQQAGIQRILLTASGGPFRTLSAEQLAQVTPEQACAHPNWSMGQKISVDSATLMNKGLELIEACWLFATTPARVEVVVHPQSVIHSMVAYNDGSVLAQLGNPDMRTPIAYGLAWPERIEAGVEALDLLSVARLDFEAPDERRFPCLRLARESFEAGGTAMAILNAANEVAVQAFLERRIGFTQIPVIIESVLNKVASANATNLEQVLSDDERARIAARHLIRQQS